jgi:crotonobetainyl-CoA:carnitine CoA-transferase CaiB-like acyl-CoA transferase
MTQAANTSLGQPLSGVRVVELAGMVSGPLASCILADQGADVIKVEPPGLGDMLRHVGFRRGGLSAIFATVNRNKRSLAVDIRNDEGRDLVRRLAGTADVVIENFRPGVLDALGLGATDLRSGNERLLYASVSGFGRSGPYAKYPAYDSVIQALSGMTALQASVEGGTPALVQTVLCDKVAALQAAQAISAALFARERGAGGGHLELSLLGTTLAFLWPDGMEAQTFLGDGVTAPATGMRDIAQVHPTRDGFVTLMAVSDDQFAGLCRALRRPGLMEDERFAHVQQRLDHAREIAGLVREALADLDTEGAWRRLRDEGVPAAPALSPDAVLADPHVLETRLFREIEHPQAGALRTPRPAVDFGSAADHRIRPAPALGEHGDEILAELGVARGDVERLRSAGVIGG